MPDKSPEIIGKNWNKEVGSWKAEKETRNEFYKKAAGLKLAVDADLIEVVKHPQLQRLKTQDDLNKEKDFTYRVKTGKTERLYNILDRYFSEIKIEPADREKEVALSLFCLTQQGVNVDLVVPSWKVEIKSGQLFITKSTGESAVSGAYLRTIPEATYPEEGYTPLPPIPGLPAKPQEEKKKTKPKPKAKAKTEPKPSAFLETI